MVHHGENGFFAETPDEYATIINNVINGKYNVEEIVNTAYEEIIRKYNTNVMSHKYIKLYNYIGAKNE